MDVVSVTPHNKVSSPDGSSWQHQTVISVVIAQEGGGNGAHSLSRHDATIY